MHRVRLKIVIVTILLISTVLLWNKSNVWASPNLSPNYQTVPTRVRKTPTNTPIPPTPASSEAPATNTPTSKPNPPKSTSTQTKVPAVTVASATPTRTLAPTATNFPLPPSTTVAEMATNTATATQIKSTLTAVPSTATPSAEKVVKATSTVVVVLPMVISPSQLPSKTGNSVPVLILTIIIVATLAVIVFMLNKGRLH